MRWRFAPVLLVIVMAGLAYGSADAEMYQADSAKLEIAEPFTTTYWDDGMPRASTTIVDGFVTISNVRHDVDKAEARVFGSSLVFDTEHIVVYLTPNDDGYEAKIYTYDPKQNALVTETILLAVRVQEETTAGTEDEDAEADDTEDSEERNLEVIIDHTHSSEYYEKFQIDVTVYDADINPDPVIFPHNGGLLDDIPVRVTLTGADEVQLLETEGKTKNGIFEYEYKWEYNDIRQSYIVLVDVDDGTDTKESKTFYLGYIE